ncbi:hypothetical protein [Falsibacillus pallidus]|uniref:hypothetical protein n=1 Tax=Falsibacillus pallidus TaxID=493781 RepID=UPI001314A79B|nr:hypothetical protein [Falsibacillus pallidus]
MQMMIAAIFSGFVIKMSILTYFYRSDTKDVMKINAFFVTKEQFASVGLANDGK